MERYEKLYTRIDEVFVGTPNTPSALSVKSEIIDNLTARYDELLEQGVGEDEAVERVVDTIGDLDELFGIKKVHSPAGDAVDSETVGQPSYRTLTPEEQESIWKRKKMRAFAIVLYIISIIPNILIGSLVDVMIAEALMFAIWSIATALIIGAGAYTPGADPKKRWLIASGVGMYIFAFVPMFLLMTSLTMGGIALMFVGWAIATALVILGAGRKSGTVKINYKKEAYDGLDNETRAIFKRIKCVLALIALVIYLWFSISTGGWIYSWLIWVIYGCVCDAVKALLLLNAEKGNNS